VSWLPDTNVVSEIRRPKPDPKVVAFIRNQSAKDQFISVVSFSEIRFGIESLADTLRRSELSDWLNNVLRPMFDGRVLPVTEEIMLRWRVMLDRGRKGGHTFTQPDLIIAATASVHGLTLVTRDVGGFRKADIAIHNPWTD